jgi:hypothetical protein
MGWEDELILGQHFSAIYRKWVLDTHSSSARSIDVFVEDGEGGVIGISIDKTGYLVIRYNDSTEFIPSSQVLRVWESN